MDHDDRPTPWSRATITGDGLTLNPWAPNLITGGPAVMSLEPLAERGIALADLYAEGDPGDEELVVRYVARTRTRASDETLLRWARTVGYRRVWMPERVVDLSAPAAELGLAETRCRVCTLEWRDDTVEFWHGVRMAGAFPGFCLGCGASLPEWTVREGTCAEQARAELTAR